MRLLSTLLYTEVFDIYSATDFQEINHGISKELTRLNMSWNALVIKADEWQTDLDEILPVSSIDSLQDSVSVVPKVNSRNVKR